MPNWDFEPRLTPEEERKILLAEITALALVGDGVGMLTVQRLKALYNPPTITCVSEAMGYAYEHPLVLPGSRLVVEISPKFGHSHVLVRLPQRPGAGIPTLGRHCKLADAVHVIDEILLNWTLGRYGYPKFPDL